jgi:two-component system capsular synthesis response regulator RcsB
MASAGAMAGGAISQLAQGNRSGSDVRRWQPTDRNRRYLHRTLATVATQKRSAMRKLNITSNADLVTYARDNGLT